MLPSQDVVFFGDSLTQGYGPVYQYWQVVRDLCAASGQPRLVANAGAGAQDSSQIAARAGGIPITITLAGNAIPADGSVPVAVTALSPLFMTATTPQQYPVTVAGIRAMLVRAADGSMTLYREGQASATTPIPANSLLTVDTASHFATWTQVIAAGRNTPNWDLPTIRRDVLAIAARQRTAMRRAIVIGIPNAGPLPPDGPSTGRTPEGVGTVNYARIVAANTELARLFGERFIDPHRYLVDFGMRDAIALNLLSEPTSGDLDDLAADIIPRSFRYDELHYNSIGHKLIGYQVYYKLQVMGY
jgi:hypothetical protein